MPPAGFEPATHGVETHCSNPLSYGGLQRTHSSPRGRGNLSQGALRRAQDVHQVLGSCGQLAIRAVGHDGVVARQVISNGAGDNAVRLYSGRTIGHDADAEATGDHGNRAIEAGDLLGLFRLETRAAIP